MPSNHLFARFGTSITPHRASHHIGVQMLVLPFTCLALVASSCAWGQVYKWADEDGVTHYSSAPPGKDKTKFKRLDKEALAVPEAKVPKREVPKELVARDLNSKVDTLQQQVVAERQARQAAEAQNQATQAAYAQALIEQQNAHNVSYVPTIPTVSGVLLLPSPQRNHFDNGCRSMGAGAMTNCSPYGHRIHPVADRSH